MREELRVKPEGDRTAKTAAGHRAIESERPEAERMCYDPYADKLVGQEGRGYAERVKETLPEVRAAVTLGTSYIDDYVKKGVRERVRQIVIMGAGYDTRALRIEELKTIKVFEVDAPPMQMEKKNKVLEIIGHLPEHIVYIPINFLKENLDDLKRKLSENDYDPQQKSLFILECVVSFLNETVAKDILRFIASFSGKGSSVIFNYTQNTPEYQKIQEEVKKMDLLPASSSEPRYTLTPEQASKMLEDQGFSQITNLSLEQIRRQYRKGEVTLSLTFYMAHAVVGE